MNTLMVMAHPDDEIIFGWPIIQSKRPEDKLSLLTLSNNSQKYGMNAVTALTEVCELNNINLLSVPPVDTNFYRLPTRYQDYTLRKVIDLLMGFIKQALYNINPDAIFTHNPMGEYGHGDHRFVFNLVSMFDVRLILTDICFYNKCHLSSNEIPRLYVNNLYANHTFSEHCVLDMDWYNAMKAVYEKHMAWSWRGHDAVDRCNLCHFD